jgi:hypothetical protein
MSSSLYWGHLHAHGDPRDIVLLLYRALSASTVHKLLAIPFIKQRYPRVCNVRYLPRRSCMTTLQGSSNGFSHIGVTIPGGLVEAMSDDPNCSTMSFHRASDLWRYWNVPVRAQATALWPLRVVLIGSADHWYSARTLRERRYMGEGVTE